MNLPVILRFVERVSCLPSVPAYILLKPQPLQISSLTSQLHVCYNEIPKFVGRRSDQFCFGCLISLKSTCSCCWFLWCFTKNPDLVVAWTAEIRFFSCLNRVMSQLFFWFNPKLSEAAAWNPTKKSRGSSPPISVSVAEFMVLPQVTLGTRSGAAGDPNEKPQARLTTFSLGYGVDTSLWWYSVLTTMVVSIHVSMIVTTTVYKQWMNNVE